MIRFDNTEVAEFMASIRGMRNPMNSWNKSDSYFDEANRKFILGQNDLKLAQTLIKAGGEHCKFLRMLQVWVDITEPRYWWGEFDTYHFNTKNSCSTMHKLFDKNNLITIDMFLYDEESETTITTIIKQLNKLRESYLNSTNQQQKDEILTSAKRILPESFLQLRTVNTNYAELRNIYFQRKNHRLKKEWGAFCKWIESLPYANELICLEKVGE